MNLYLIRHGRTDANAKHIYCGSTDLPLLEEGIAELRQKHYQVPENCHYITSGMRRTEQTLYYLFGEVEHTQDLRFREMDFGIFEMHSYHELKEREDYQKWISGDNEANITPGGESGNQMRERVLEGLRHMQSSSKDIVLITHGGVIAAMMSFLFPEEDRSRFEWQPNPGEGYLVTAGTWEALPKSTDR